MDHPKNHSNKGWSQLAKQFQREIFLKGLMLKLCSLMAAILVGTRVIGYDSERRPPTIQSKFDPIRPNSFREDF